MRLDRPEALLAGPMTVGATNPHVLFVHDDGPGQFCRLGEYLARGGWPVTFAASRAVGVPGCASLTYQPHREPSEQTHPYAQAFDRATLNGQGFARAMLAARRDGLEPDIIVSHAGPGAGMFAADVFPRARKVAYAEWWYGTPAPDLAWLDNPVDLPETEQGMVERARNAAMALEIASSDVTICPTAFQAKQFPVPLRSAITVHHDGIDTDDFKPAEALPSAPSCPVPLRGLRAETPLVTYATRGMEPHRGFPHFMASVPAIQRAVPHAIIAIAGDNSVAYGTDSMRRIDWLERARAIAGIDWQRVVLLGTLPEASYRWLLRRSDAHVYLTVPFVLSWSMLEAMATACPLVLSDTEPVREFATSEHALLTDMRDPAKLANAVTRAVGDPEAAKQRGRSARREILRRIPASRIFPEKANLLREL